MDNIRIKSVKYNFVMNLIRNFSAFIFPMITFPYLSRVLLPEGIGRISFADSIIRYLMLFAALGISLYGMREIAKFRDNRQERSRVLSELFTLNIISTAITFLAFIILLCFVPGIRLEWKLFLITSLNIIFTTFGIEWFYQGIEKYDYITIRVLFVRIISVIAMFIFVKRPEDYIISAFITVAGNTGGNLFNFFHSGNYASIKFDVKSGFSKHLKPVLSIWAANFAAGFYLIINTIILGFISGNVAVGLYTASYKVIRLVITLIASLGIALNPRLSYLIHNNEIDKYNKMAKKAYHFILLVTLPSAAGLLIMSKNILVIFSGNKFLDALPAMKIITPVIIFILLTNFFGQQILYSHHEEKKILKTVLIGSVVGLILNFILIPFYSFKGAAVATLLTEAVVCLFRVLYGRKYISFKLFDVNIIKYIIATFVMSVAVFIIINYFNANLIINSLIGILSGIIVYFVTLKILKEELINKELCSLLKVVEKILKKRS